MYAVMITSGTRGDVQPFVALGKALKENGHRVAIATHAEFKSWIEGHGLEYLSLHGDVRAILANPHVRQHMRHPNPFTIRKHLDGAIRELFTGMLKDSLVACQGADLVIYNHSTTPAALAAEKLGLPHIAVALQPLSRTGSHPSCMMNVPSMGKTLNRLSHRFVEISIWWLFGSVFNDLRVKELNLPPFPRGGMFSQMYRDKEPMLCAFSNVLVPTGHDWPKEHVVTGTLILNETFGWVPPPALIDFLKDGEKPIYVGIGSMMDDDAEKFVDMVVAASQKTGGRILLSSGWAGFDSKNLPENILLVRDVPHDWLFPKLSGAIHHGGAGTTAASLRAGIPTFVVPYLADQPFWGRQVAKLGCGPKPIAREKLTIKSITKVMNDFKSDGKYAAYAKNVGEAMKKENGIEAAKKVIFAFAASKHVL